MPQCDVHAKQQFSCKITLKIAKFLDFFITNVNLEIFVIPCRILRAKNTHCIHYNTSLQCLNTQNAHCESRKLRVCVSASIIFAADISAEFVWYSSW